SQPSLRRLHCCGAHEFEARVCCGCCRRLRRRAQDLATAAKRVLSTVAQHQDLVARRQQAGAMRDQDDDGAARFRVMDRFEQTPTSPCFSLRRLSRAATKLRQLAIAVSIGASARAIITDAAIIAPGISSCRITK